MGSYPKSERAYYRSTFWWVPEAPWYVEHAVLKASNGRPLRTRFATYDEAKAYLQANLILRVKSSKMISSRYTKGSIFETFSSLEAVKEFIDFFHASPRKLEAAKKGIYLEYYLDHVHEVKCDQVYYAEHSVWDANHPEGVTCHTPGCHTIMRENTYKCCGGGGGACETWFCVDCDANAERYHDDVNNGHASCFLCGDEHYECYLRWKDGREVPEFCSPECHFYRVGHIMRADGEAAAVAYSA